MNKRSSIVSVLLVILFCVILLNPLAANFNSVQYFVGDRASGMGGASVALANDPSALWNNPAGLALMKKSQIDISGNSYSFINRTREGAVSVDLGAIQKDMDIEESDFSIVPTSLSYGFKPGAPESNLGLAFGVFVPYSTSVQASIDDSISDGSNSMDVYSVLRKETRLYVMSFGVGYVLSSHINVGASVGFGYLSNVFSQEWRQYLSLTTPVVNNRFYSRYENNETTCVTMMGNVGIQVQFSNHKIGMFYRSPHLVLYNDSKYELFIDSVSTLSGVENHAQVTASPDLYKRIPAIASIGYAYEKEKSFAVSIEATWCFKSDELDNGVINFQGGFEYYLDEAWAFRSGFFTDFSQSDELTSTSSGRVTDRLDYYGATLSLSMLSKDNDKEYTTTLGLVYRLGIGQYKTVSFKTTGPEEGTKDWITHGIALYLSETVSF